MPVLLGAPHQDHPRTRGEHEVRLPGRSSLQGPPPHARGAQLGSRAHPARARTTPARAGSTTGLSAGGNAGRDHPRTRGEHAMGSNCLWGPAGPPPHARGAPRERLPVQHHLGTTPARAGSTPAPVRGGPGAGDHPRTRGEHHWAAEGMGLREGPPPHARGALTHPKATTLNGGTTPARAGSTPGEPPGAGTGRDHPRTRGEHRSRSRRATERRGPPPHARGAPDHERVRDVRPGTTPARAGSTLPDLGLYLVDSRFLARTRNSGIPNRPLIPPSRAMSHPHLTTDHQPDATLPTIEPSTRAP